MLVKKKVKPGPRVRLALEGRRFVLHLGATHYHLSVAESAELVRSGILAIGAFLRQETAAAEEKRRNPPIKVKYAPKAALRGPGAMAHLCKCNHEKRDHIDQGGDCLDTVKRTGKPCRCTAFRKRG